MTKFEVFIEIVKVGLPEVGDISNQMISLGQAMAIDPACLPEDTSALHCASDFIFYRIHCHDRPPESEPKWVRYTFAWWK